MGCPSSPLEVAATATTLDVVELMEVVVYTSVYSRHVAIVTARHAKSGGLDCLQSVKLYVK